MSGRRVWEHRERRSVADRRLFAPMSMFGLVLGALGFVAALMPGMVPRTSLTLGLLAGLCFAAAYGVGVSLVHFATLLELAPINPDRHRKLRTVALICSGGLLLYGLARAPAWQNSVNAVMGLPPVESLGSLLVAALALAVVLSLVLLARLFRRAAIIFANLLLVVLPVRAALLGGFVLAAMLFWSIGSGILARGLVDGLDATYANVDALIPAGSRPPGDPLKSGSRQSNMTWASLGAAGRDFVLARPDRAQIAGLAGETAMEPIRVYVGVNSADDPAARARLALEELKRTGAFARGTLVIATPTGTGWVDPAATLPLEYLLRGDVATVAVQYSYLPSWLSLMVEPERGAETARQVFRLVYGHWLTLPKDSRPRLYLFGLSLGALNSDLAVDVYDILAQPFDGALWAGPPFPSRTWNAVVAARNPDTPVWLPRYSDGRMFRFATQDADLSQGYAAWGPLRIVYLQYPSDPIVFFESSSLLRRPRIAADPRAPDISPTFVWIPVVTFLQGIVDMVTATGTPSGFGHVYAGTDYLDAWIALTDPADWTEADIDRLRRRIKEEDL